MMRLELFGPVALWRGDNLVTGRAVQKTRLALLSLLAAAGERGLTRDRLVGVLWPDMAPDTARRRLSDSLYVIRKELGEDVLTMGGDTLALNPDRIDSDVAAFERAARDSDPDCLIGLYAGPFLDGFFLKGSNEFEAWVDGQRMRLAREYRRIMASAAERATNDGNLAGAVRYRRAITDTDPYDSRAALELMRALEASGDQPGAILHASEHAVTLKSDLELEPDPEIGRYAEELRASAPATEWPLSGLSVPPHPAVPPNPTARSAPPARPGSTVPSTDRALPRRRGRVGAGAAWIVTLAAVLVAVVAVRSRATADRAGLERIVFVAPFADATGQGRSDVAGLVAADWVTRGLVDTWLVDVIDGRLELGAAGVIAPSDREAALVLAAKAGAGTLVWGTYEHRGDDIGFTAYLIDIRSGSAVDSVIVPPDPRADRFEQIELVRAGLIGRLAERIDSRLDAWATSIEDLPSYVAYSLLVTAQQERWSSPMHAVLPLLEQAVALDSSFSALPPYLAMAYAESGRTTKAAQIAAETESDAERMSPIDLARVRVAVGTMRGDEQAVLEAARRLTMLAPRSSYFSRDLAAVALANRRPHEAIERLDMLRAAGTDLAPGLSDLLRARALHALGLHDLELEAARSARIVVPGMLEGDIALVMALAAAGQVDSVFAHVRTALGAPPGSPGGEDERIGVSLEAMRMALAAGRELQVHGYAGAGAELLDMSVHVVQAARRSGMSTRLEEGWLAYYGRQLGSARAIFAELSAAEEPGRSAVAAEARSGLALVAARQGWIGEGDGASAETGAAIEVTENPGGRRSYLRARLAAIRGDASGAARELQTSLQNGLLLVGDPVLGPHNETDFLIGEPGAPLRRIVSDISPIE